MNPSSRPSRAVRLGQSLFVSLALLGILLPATPQDVAAQDAAAVVVSHVEASHAEAPCASTEHGAPDHQHAAGATATASSAAVTTQVAGIPWWRKLLNWLFGSENDRCPDCNLDAENCGCVCGSGGGC